jgi:hypothetical protein
VFGRRPPSDPLKERMRKLSERPSQPAPPAAKTNARPVREATFRNGALLYGEGHRLAVVIKDLSEHGARIEFFQKIELPDDVVLSEPMMKLRRAAIVVWRRDGAAGLQFK